MSLETKINAKTFETIIENMTHVNTLEYTPIITAAIALSGVLLVTVINWFINKKQFKGLVISQSRINWIQDVRKHSAKYLKHMMNIKIIINRMEILKKGKKSFEDEIRVVRVNEYNPEIEKEVEVEQDDPSQEKHNKYYYSKINEKKNEMDKALNELSIELDKVMETTQLIRLYLPKVDKDKNINKDHAKLQNLMDEMQKVIDSVYKGEELLDSKEYILKLEEFTNEISAYLKQEWDVAKKNQ